MHRTDLFLKKQQLRSNSADSQTLIFLTRVCSWETPREIFKQSQTGVVIHTEAQGRFSCKPTASGGRSSFWVRTLSSRSALSTKASTVVNIAQKVISRRRDRTPNNLSWCKFHMKCHRCMKILSRFRTGQDRAARSHRGLAASLWSRGQRLRIEPPSLPSYLCESPRLGNRTTRAAHQTKFTTQRRKYFKKYTCMAA